MRVKAITVYSYESSKLEALKQSAERVGIELTALQTDWRGFGTKIIELREHLHEIEGQYTHFIFVDAYDTLFLKHPEIPKDKILFSTEKHKWPDANAPYPETKEVWAYLNSGCYSAPIDDYLKLTDRFTIDYDIDDQRYFTDIYLNHGGIELDTKCNVFQSYAFEAPGDFTLHPFKNNITGTSPAIIHFNGKCHNPQIYNMVKYSTLKDLQDAWLDTPEVHKDINETFAELVNASPSLKAHRDFVEQNVFGFGERSFQWMWNLIVKEMPESFTFLEIGVFKGQVLSLIELLANQQLKKAKRYGVTPLSTEGGVWESDYAKDLITMHDAFKLDKGFTIIKELSNSDIAVSATKKLSLDILYIDGSHQYKDVVFDFNNYTPLIKSGGYLVVDDAACKTNQPFGYFQGIHDVCLALEEFEVSELGKQFKFIASVVHVMIYKRV